MVLLLCRDGKSRHLAFIGFRTNEEAAEALKYFNNTYIDTSKITCEVLYFLNGLQPFLPLFGIVSIGCIAVGDGMHMPINNLLCDRLLVRLVTLMLLALGAVIP
jgi:hypothetical protein